MAKHSPPARQPWWHVALALVAVVVLSSVVYRARLAAALPGVAANPDAPPAALRPGRTAAGPGPAKRLPTAAGAWRYNVVLIILEGVGQARALTPMPDGRVAMPFLAELSERGMAWTRHYASGDRGTRTSFSLLGGRYPEPDERLPSLAAHLGDGYEKFLVTPGSLAASFSPTWLRTGGLAETWDVDTLPAAANAGDGHHDDQAVEFFLQRVDKAGQAPFLGIYHAADPGDEPLTHLHELDSQLARIFEHCERAGLADHTIFVVVGDRGEAVAEPLALREENVQTPAILLHPQLFPTRRVAVPTSHVDLLPTLLDALGRPYDRSQLDGESLYQTTLQRPYVYVHADERLSSIDTADIKMTLTVASGACQAFDLRADPEERAPHACETHAAQHADLLRLPTR